MIIYSSGFGFRVSRKYGNVVYMVYLGIIFPYFPSFFSFSVGFRA